MKRRILMIAFAAAMVAAAAPGMAGSITDECVVDPATMAFDGAVGRGEATVTPPGPTNPNPQPTYSITPPNVTQLDPSVTVYPPSADPGDTEIIEPDPVIVDHDEDGVPDDVSGYGGVVADPQIDPGAPPTVAGIGTEGEVNVDPDTSVDIGGVSRDVRGGAYELEAAVTCTTDWGDATGSLLVGKVYIEGGPDRGTAQGTVACEGGSGRGFAVISFDGGVLAGHAYFGTWESNWRVDRYVVNASLLYHGVLEDREDDPLTDHDESAYLHFVADSNAGGGWAGSLFPQLDEDPDGEGPEPTPGEKCDEGEAESIPVDGYLLPIQLGAYTDL